MGGAGRGRAGAADPRARLRALGLGAAARALAERLPRASRSTTAASARATSPPGPYTVERAGRTTRCRCSTRPASSARTSLGASLGGMIAQELAAERPSASTGSCSCCTTPGGAGAVPMPEATRAALRRGAAARARGGAAPLRRERARARRARRARRGDLRATASRTRPIRRAGRRRPPPGWRFERASARAIAAPTLVVTGTADNVVDPRNSRAARRARSRAPALERDRQAPGTCFFWERPDEFVRIVDGVPRDEPLTVDRMLRDRARITPRPRRDRSSATARWTYAELDARSDELAAGLEPRRARLDADRQLGASMSRFFACAKAGAILHPISWRLAPAEVAYQLDDAEPALLPRRGRAPRARRRGARARAASQPRARAARRSGRPAPPDADDPLLLIYTSRHDRQAEGRAAHARELLLDEPLVRPRDRASASDDVVLQVLPQFHCGGWNVQPLLAWWKGATVVIERGFDAARALELIERERVTTMMGVPANYLFMAQEPRLRRAPTSRRCGSPSSAARRCRCALLDDVGRARRRDRPGLRADRGGAERALPRARGRARARPARPGKPYPYVDVRPVGRGRAARARAERLRRLLAQRRGDRGRVPRRLAAHRRRRRARRGGRLPDPRPAQGHGRLRRRERLSGRDRGGAARASGRRRGRRRRRARRALGRGVRRVRRARRAASPRRSCARTAASGSRASRCRRRSTSSTSCRATRWARS